MEVHSSGKEKGPLVALVLALIVLGLGSLYLTWRSIAHQRQIVEDHMILTGSSILRGVDTNLLRIMRSLHMNPQVTPFFSNMAEELFTELASSEDIVFITLYDETGKPLVTSEKGDDTPTITLPVSVTGDIEPGRVWHVMAEIGKKSVLISGIRTRPGMSALISGKPAPDPGPRPGMRHMGQSPGRNQGRREPGGPAVFLVVDRKSVV